MAETQRSNFGVFVNLSRCEGARLPTLLHVPMGTLANVQQALSPEAIMATDASQKLLVGCRADRGDGHEHSALPVTVRSDPLAVGSLALVGEVVLHVEPGLCAKQVDPKFLNGGHRRMGSDATLDPCLILSTGRNLSVHHFMGTDDPTHVGIVNRSSQGAENDVGIGKPTLCSARFHLPTPVLSIVPAENLRFWKVGGLVHWSVHRIYGEGVHDGLCPVAEHDLSGTLRTQPLAE